MATWPCNAFRVLTGSGMPFSAAGAETPSVTIMKLHLALLVALAVLVSVHCADPEPPADVHNLPRKFGVATPEPVIQPMIPGVKDAPVDNLSTALKAVAGALPDAGDVTPQLTPSGAGWRTAKMLYAVGASQQVYLNSPSCPGGYEATACGFYSGATPVVAVAATSTMETGKALYCQCYFTNTYNWAMPRVYYHCKAYCQ